MTGPFIFIGTHRIREEKLAEFIRQQEGVPLVHKPRHFAGFVRSSAEA